MTKLERFYGQLSRLTHSVPKPVQHCYSVLQLRDMLWDTSMAIAKQRNPQTLDDVRHSYRLTTPLIQQCMIQHMMEHNPQAPDDDRDWIYDAISEIPVSDILQCPANTPTDLAGWLAAEYQRRFPEKAASAS